MNRVTNYSVLSGCLRRSSVPLALIPWGLLIAFAVTACDKSDKEKSDAVAPTQLTTPATSEGDKSYAYGTKLDFKLGGNAANYQVSGWSKPETEGTWTDGDMGRLAFDVPPTDSPLTFKATVSGFVKPPELASQPVDVFINGEQVAHWEIAVKGLAQMEIPSRFCQAGRLQIDFKLPKAASPDSLGVSIDRRRLGIFFYDMVLVKP